MTTPLWTPLESRVSQTTLHLFSSWLSSRTGKSLFGYEELHTFSIDDPATFWSALRDFTKISEDKGEPPSSSTAKMPGARFFPGAKLNFAENLLRNAGPDAAMCRRASPLSVCRCCLTQRSTTNEILKRAAAGTRAALAAMVASVRS